MHPLRPSCFAAALALSALVAMSSLPVAAESTPTFQATRQAELPPFTSPDEAVEFLRTAKVIRVEPVGSGTTRPNKVLLEKDGLRLSAIFHQIDRQQRDVRVGNQFFRVFYDSYMAQCAAYDLARVLGLDNVPPTVLRRIKGRDGSLQLWVEGAMTEKRRGAQGLRPPNTRRWIFQLQVMRLFDNLIYNDDRNSGNMVIDSGWKLWMIDHSRSFQRLTKLRDPGRVTMVERSLWQRLRNLDDDQIADHCWLKELMATAREKDSRVVGGALYLKFPHGCQPELSWQCRRMLGESVHWGQVRPYTRKEGPGTGSLLVHRSVFEKVGRFDESFTLRGYDTDFYRRVREAGIDAWFTRYAVAYHVTPHSRLEDEYFKETSLHNGWHFARRDLLEFGQVKTVALLVARLGQATVLHVPRWLIARLSGSKAAVLTARVRLWRTQGYTRSALHWIAPRFFSQRRFFSKYEFRADQIRRVPCNSPANAVTNGSRS